MNRLNLLKHAVPLVKTHGFTRTALAYSFPAAKPGAAPLEETAVTALFGQGDAARVTLINAWMEQGLEEMWKANESSGGPKDGNLNSVGKGDTRVKVEKALLTRLEWNVHALPYLSEAFALLISPPLPSPPIDPRPILAHAASIANTACASARDVSIGTTWYTRRAALAAAYSAAELHQLTSPQTANAFLLQLLDTASQVENATNDTAQFAEFVVRSWRGIARSFGI